MSGKTTVMKPGAAIAACFGKFARCYGRSCRAEFIWFLLFFLVALILITYIPALSLLLL